MPTRSPPTSCGSAPRKPSRIASRSCCGSGRRIARCATAQRDSQLQSALTLVQDIYASAGIDIAPIDYRDLDTGDAERIRRPRRRCRARRALFASLGTQADADHALSIVFVEHFEAGAGKTVRGKTTGLPMPPPHPLLPRRGGIAVPLDTLPDSAERDRRTDRPRDRPRARATPHHRVRRAAPRPDRGHAGVPGRARDAHDAPVMTR